MIPYIMYAALVTAVYFLFYRLLLHKETFFRLNRWFFLGGLICSFALPVLPVPASWSVWTRAATATQSSIQTHAPTQTQASATAKAPPAYYAPAIHATRKIVPATPARTGTLTGPHTPEATQQVAGTTPAGDWDWLTLSLVLKVLYYGYLCGALIFGLNLLLQFVVIGYQIKTSNVTKDGAFYIVETRGDKAPCSFGRYIFINRNNYDEETYHQILTHEKVHAQQRHSVDILLAELGIVLQWFNPFAWFFRKALEDNLEFLTDAAMIRNPRVNASCYQMSLLRVSAPHLPLSITSNYNQSLLKKRIVMMHTKQSSAGTTWKYFFLLPLLAVMICVFNHTMAINAQKALKHSTADTSKPKRHTGYTDVVVDPVVVTVDPVVTPVVAPVVNVNPNPQVNVDINPQVDVDVNPQVDVDVDPQVNLYIDQRSGTWMATINGDTVEVTFKSSDQHNNWTNTEDFLKSEFSAIPTTKSTFTITREAGVLTLTGMFDGNEGFGHFTFTENKDFEAYIKGLGYDDMDDQKMFRLFSANITRKAVADIQQTGFKHISLHELISMSEMKINAAYVDSWKQLGFTDLSPHELVSLKATNVDAAFVNEMKSAGFKDISAHDLVGAKSMNLTPEYIRSWAQSGFSDLTVHELIGLKSMDIDMAYVKDLQSAGLKDLSAHDVMGAKSQNIDAAYVRSWSDAGYKELSMHELVGLKSQNVDEAYVKDLKDAGLTDLEPHQLVGAKSMGITGDYVRSWAKTGLKDLSIHDLMALKSQNIDAAYIESWKNNGYPDLGVHELIGLKSQNITPEFAKGYNALGFKNISAHMLISLKSMDVTPAYITAMKNKGFNSNDLQEYIKLKTFK